MKFLIIINKNKFYFGEVNMPEYKLAKNKNIVKMFRKDNTLLIYVILVAIFIGIIFASFFAFYNIWNQSK